MNLFDDLIRVGIVGTRRRDSEEAYRATRGAFIRLYVPGKTVIVSGGCPQGGDRFAEIIAAEFEMPRDVRWSDVRKDSEGNILDDLEGQRIVIHMPDVAAFAHVPPRWRKTTANYSRNGLIARDSLDALIACVAPDRTGGTEDTIKKYRRLFRREPILV